MVFGDLSNRPPCCYLVRKFPEFIIAGVRLAPKPWRPKNCSSIERTTGTASSHKAHRSVDDQRPSLESRAPSCNEGAPKANLFGKSPLA
jgi:hypothetical protein